jgi:hypothetical protein
LHRFAGFEAQLGTSKHLDKRTSCPVWYRKPPGTVRGSLSCGLC